MREVPQHRWDASSVTVEGLSPAQSGSVRHGGFIEGTERFDNSWFGISRAEAGEMDPQQRILLETGYASFRSAGMARDALYGSDSAVFLCFISACKRCLMPAIRLSV